MRPWGIVVATAVLLSGCSLVNPFVVTERQSVVRDPSKPDPVLIELDRLKATGAIGDRTYTDLRGLRGVDPTETVTLPVALVYGERVRSAYREALGDQARLQAWLGIGLIPLSAAAIGLGATGGSSAAILALGLTGAAGYGTGTWLLNRPRQAAYVAGIKAITCAEDAMTPLNVPIAVQKGLETNLADLRKTTQALQTAQAKLTATVATADAKVGALTTVRPPLAVRRDEVRALVVTARDELKAADAALTVADKAHGSGVALKAVLDTAGGQLVAAINKIADTVDGLVVETQRDPQALATIISGLGGAYRTFTTVPEGMAITRTPPPKGADGGMGQSGDVAPEKRTWPLTEAEEAIFRAELDALAVELRSQLADLRTATAAVTVPRRWVADTVNAVAKDPPVEKLKGCGVQAGELITMLTLDPAGPYEIAPPGSISFTLKGGLSPYGASIAQGVSGLTVTQAAPFSPAITVAAAKDTPDGAYTVHLTDGKGQIVTATITVRSKNGAGEDPAPDALRKIVDSLKTEQTFRLLDDKVQFKTTKGEITTGRKDVVTVTVEAVSVAAEVTDADLAKVTPEAVRDALAAKINADKNKLVLSPDGLKAIEITNLKKVRSGTAAGQSADVGASGCPERAIQGAVSADPTFAALSPPDRQRVQKALCLTGNAVDGRWGRVTKGRLGVYQCQNRLTEDGVLSKEVARRLLGESDTAIKDRCGR